MLGLSRRACIGLFAGLGVAVLSFAVLLIWVVGSSDTDAMSLWAEYAANADATKARYAGKEIVVRGVVRDTAITSYGAVMHLEHRNNAHADRFPADKVWVPFNVGAETKAPDGPPQPKKEPFDMGFAFQFDQFGRVIIPWRNGSAVRILATPIFEGNGKIILSRAKLL